MRKTLFGIVLLCLALAGSAGAGRGQILYEYWLDVGGATVADLLNHADYQADLPDGSSVLYMCEGPRDWAEYYGARIAGYIIPPRTGNYAFWIATDDAGQLYMSPDDDPDHLSTSPIARVDTYCAQSPPSWNEFPDQQSAVRVMEGGKPYYFEAFVKEAGGSDNIAVGWQGPDISLTVVPGVYMSDVHPFGAQSPSPSHRQGGIDTNFVGINDDLSWQAPPADPNVGSPVYDVYIGTEPNLPGMTKAAEKITATTVDPGTLAYATKYYWRVQVFDASRTDPESGGPAQASSGVYWWFVTEDALPVITTQPADAFVRANEAAVFTVVVQSSSAVEYAWYKVSDPSAPVGTEATLVIDPATAEDGYYCKVTNSGGTATSRTAQLRLKRLIAHWPLDGNVAPAAEGLGQTGTIYGTGASNPSAMFSEGMVGQAIGVNVEAERGEYVVFGSVGITGEMPRTIACWAKNSVWVDQIVDWCTVFGFTSPTAANEQSFDFNRRGGQPYYCIHRYGAEWNMTPIDGAWHFLVATFENDLVQWYVDGVFGGSAGTNLQTQDIVHLGKRAHSDPLWRGWVDDARVYNYVLSPYEAAQLYIDAVPEAVICPEPPAGSLDGDCFVNLADAAVAAMEWLSCNRVPECR